MDVIPAREPIELEQKPGTVEMVTQHDGSVLALHKLSEHYDPTDRAAAISFLQQRQALGEIVTGLLYVDPEATDLHDALQTIDRPLNALGDAELTPSRDALEGLNASFR
jgi:2-oxoglutarate ferredoxin oxidoreductase subunit beta